MQRGFEPPCLLNSAQILSRDCRYNHFGTASYMSFAYFPNYLFSKIVCPHPTKVFQISRRLMMWTDAVTCARFRNIFFFWFFSCLDESKHLKQVATFAIREKAFKGKRPLMGHPGFEPETYRLKVDCSSAELISHSRLCLGCDEDRCIG